MNMSTRQHRAGSSCPPVGADGRCAVRETRPVRRNRTSMIRTGGVARPADRGSPGCTRGLHRPQPCASQISARWRGSCPRCPIQHLSGGGLSRAQWVIGSRAGMRVRPRSVSWQVTITGPVTDLARGHVARHDAHARPAVALAPAPDAGADGRNAARRASPRGHVIDGSAPLTNAHLWGVLAFLLQAISCDVLGDAGAAR